MNLSGGGIGVSILVLGLVWVVVRLGIKVGLVEFNFSVGGIDLLLGIERKDGWWWFELVLVCGVMIDLGFYVFFFDGVEVVSVGRVGVYVFLVVCRVVVDFLVGDYDFVVVDLGGFDILEVMVNVKVGVVVVDFRFVMMVRG